MSCLWSEFDSTRWFVFIPVPYLTYYCNDFPCPGWDYIRPGFVTVVLKGRERQTRNRSESV